MSVRAPQEHVCSGPVNKTLFRDPVCGMHVSATTRYTAIVGGNAYYFCSENCLSRFNQSVQLHTAADADTAAGRKAPEPAAEAD